MMKKNIYYWQGLFFLALSQVMVSINIVASKKLLASMPFFVVLLMRFSLGAIIILPAHWVTAGKHNSIKYYLAQLTRKDWLHLFAQALSAGVIFNCFMLIGLYYTDANVAGIITSALPAIIVLMSWVILKEKITSKQVYCIIFAVAGLVIISLNKVKSINIGHSLGDLLIFLSLFPEAIYYILNKIHRIPLPIFLIATLMNVINALFLLPIMAFAPLNIGHLDLITYLTLFILGLSSGIFYYFWFIGYQLVDITLASLSTAIMPVSTVLLAYLFLGEQLTSWQGLGMFMVMFSIYIYAR